LESTASQAIGVLVGTALPRTLRVAEVDIDIGEIGVFARDQKRMATVQCISACQILELTEAKAKEIYYQNPAFAYAVLQVIISRLMEDITLSKLAVEQPIPKGLFLLHRSS
jgi:CRP-like cAMP-binding protein